MHTEGQEPNSERHIEFMKKLSITQQGSYSTAFGLQLLLVSSELLWTNTHYWSLSKQVALCVSISLAIGATQTFMVII